MTADLAAVPNFPLERYRVLRFSETDEIDEEAVIAFWVGEGAMRQELARERVGEVIFVAVEEEGRLAGISTAFLRWSSQLRTEMWHYRTFVGAEHRLSSLGLGLLQQSRAHLEHRFISGVDTRAPGIMFELENQSVKKAHNEAVWKADWAPGISWTFIGENARGDHLRVYYFPGALAPLTSGG